MEIAPVLTDLKRVVDRWACEPPEVSTKGVCHDFVGVDLHGQIITVCVLVKEDSLKK